MPASITDKISRVSSGVRPVSTTVSTLRNAGNTTLACADLTGWTTTEKVHFVTYKIDGQSKVIAGSQSDWTGIVSGATINNLTLTGGSDNGNAAGDIVELLPTAQYAKDLGDAMLASHNQDGTLKNNAVTTNVITDASVTTAKLADGTVTAIKNALPLTDSYSATAVAAVGEFTDALKKTFDVTNIPTGHGFIITATNIAGDGSAQKNVIARINYNSLDVISNVMTQYHQTAMAVAPLVKAAGQNSVTVYFGGSAASQSHYATLLQTS